MDIPLLLDHVRSDAAELAAAATADLGAAVPSCPGWDREQLVRHVCVPTGWTIAQIEAGPDEQRRFRDAARPPDDANPVPFFESQVERLGSLLTELDPAVTWPTWAGPQPSIWLARRITHEIAVHRFDVAGGEVSPEAGADGVDELLDVFAPILPAEQFADMRGSIHLHATDVERKGEWLVTFSSGGISVSREHAKGDVAVRGGAGDLFLWSWNRVPLDDRFEVFGDADLARRWSDLVAI